ncbi:hypothetical protein CAPTEDRAFT_205311 [Capitella teleta]|uniref:Protein kinase domain-containing protein n=1 Tax=Capitella teleta TaxID=283909 RepID=R7TM97_CAPTE|nr:hypothetical protein CAPTEDRAFT_205311 [Capitella teleta]|eukprot:ELT94759.1 hypothetical protein CAPTEDRAFT_205311 [Capitella teleta]
MDGIRHCLGVISKSRNWASFAADELRGHFTSCGVIDDITICAGKGPNMKFGFVKFATENAAIDASRLHGTIRIGKFTPRINYDASKNKVGGRPQSRWEEPHNSKPRDGFNKPDIVPVNRPNAGGFKPKEPSGPIREESLVMSHIESPTMFWAQRSSSAEELKELSDTLNAVCPKAPVLSDQPNMTKIYGCKYSVDDSWYRCKVLRYLNINESEVLYLDFGNQEEVMNSSICELPPALTAKKPIATRHMLYGLRPCLDPKSTAFDQGCHKLQELMEGKILNVKIQANINGDSAVIVDSDGVDVNQEILNHNFAVRRVQIPSQQQQQQQQQQPQSHSSQNHFQLEETPRANSQWNEGKNSASPQSNLPTWGEGSSPHGSKNNSDNGSAAKAEADRLRRELETVKQELSASKGTIRTLKQEQLTILQQLQETSLASKVNGLVVNVSKVRALRTQFPSDGETADGIEHALEAVQESKGVVLEAGNQAACRVFDKCGMYQCAQEAIKACSNQDGLSDLIACRDQCRRMLCSAIEEFLSTTRDLPLEQQSQHLNQVLSNLTSVYSGFLDLPCDDLPLAEAVPLYTAWRSQKKAEHQEVRTKTNTTHNTLAGALAALQKLLCIEDSMQDEAPSTVGALDSLIHDFNVCLAEEIRFTDVRMEADRVGFITMLLKALVTDIKGQLKEIMQLQQLSQKNQELLSNLQPWLEERPCVKSLLVVRKSIKALKSKLRHRLADLQDIEEDNSDEDVDQLDNLRTEVTALRNDLQAAFREEAKALESLADLADRHFPELIIQNPDLNLKDEIRYCGLLKDGWSLDHFDKQPANDGSTAILTSFSGSPVLLKEFLLDESLGVNSQDFLQSAVSYKMCSSPHLVPIDSIFFVKRDRHAFILLPYHKVSLRQTVLAEGQLSSLAVYELLWGVLQGLHALHSNGIVHGALNPANIIVMENGSSLLADFDFSKSLKQRASLCAQTFDGLSFHAPEALSSVDVPGKAADMYCFGLLILWLVYHQDVFPVTSDGMPDLQALRLEEPTGGLIRNLLSASPAQRLTSSNLILSPLFQKKPQTVDTEATTLQLRPPKTPSPPIGSRPPGSILKNGSPATLSPPDSDARSKEEKDCEQSNGDVALGVMNQETAVEAAAKLEIEDTAVEVEIAAVTSDESETAAVSVQEIETAAAEESVVAAAEPADLKLDDFVQNGEESLEEMLEDVANLDEIPPPLEYSTNEE